MPETHEILIVGAGLSGLSTAHFLHTSAPDLDILMLEQDGRPGGAVRSFRENGYLAEWGPHGFLDNNPASRALLSETGLDRIAQKAPLGSFVRYVCHGGKLVQLPQKPQALLATPLLSPLGKLRLLGDLFKKPRSAEQSVGQWAAYRFGSEILPLVDAAITEARSGDLPAVLALLDAAGLPLEGVAEHFGQFLVARGSDRVVGAAGLELYGGAALLRSIVVHPEWRGRQLGQRLNPSIHVDLDAQALCLRDQGRGNLPAAAPSKWPADGVGQHSDHEPERGGEWSLQRDHGMGGESGEQGPRGRLTERDAAERARRQQCRQAEAGQGNRMAWRADDGAQQRRKQTVHIVQKWPEEPTPGRAVPTEPGGSVIKRPFEHDRAIRREHVGHGGGRLHPLQTALLEAE